MSIRDAYESLVDDERVSFLYAMENDLEGDLLGFLLSVMNDISDYDLARIEAIKSAGLLASRNTGGAVTLVVDNLISLAVNDSDDDVRNYALQALC